MSGTALLLRVCGGQGVGSGLGPGLACESADAGLVVLTVANPWTRIHCRMRVAGLGGRHLGCSLRPGQMAYGCGQVWWSAGACSRLPA